jgi:ABC-type polysaccharide/polyol phosphate export permease
LLLVAADRSLSWHVLWLPAVVVLQVMWLAGLTWVLASITVALPDVSYFVNLFVFLLMFVSPIGFKPEMLPKGFGWTIYLNPIFYMTEMYRDSMLNQERATLTIGIVYVAMCLTTFALGSAFFERFKSVLADYE